MTGLSRKLRPGLWLALGLCCAGSAGAAPGLPAVAARTREITVSGVSAGGYMAVQYHFAHSASVSGAGVLAGGPYDCAEGSSWRALTSCMAPRPWSPLPEPGELRERVERQARLGTIDDTAGLAGDRAWIFSGGRDKTVERPVVEALVRLYRVWLDAAAVHFETRPDAGHGMISVEDTGASPCQASSSPFINRCGDLDAAGELLGHLLGVLAPKREPAAGELTSFDQTPYLGEDPAASGMAAEGYVFVPRDCRQGGCRVHVAFHGCGQSGEQLRDRFARSAGYLEWAAGNRLVVLFPQVEPRNRPSGAAGWILNPAGCWDWWGYTGEAYATRGGRQIAAVHAMIERLGATPQGDLH